MKTMDCQRYLEDPETGAGHLDTCDECRALFGPQPAPDVAPVHIDSLPMAPWEGASYRSWRVVVVAASLVVTMALALGFVAGLSPLGGLTRALRSAFPSIEILQALAFRVGGAMQHVPDTWLIGIGVSFVVVNTLLVVLLRRPTKGLDV